jgi:hypothetical protein
MLVTGAVAALVLTIVVTQRLSADALALLIGVGAGVVLMAPAVVLAVLLWRREARTRTTASRSQPAASPPVVVVAPPGMQRPRLERTPSLWTEAPAQRTFTIVGGAEEDERSWGREP